MATETTYSSLRANLAAVLDQVIDQQATVIVRRRGARDVALIPASELAGLMETAHLLRSPRNARRLMTALRRAKAGKLRPGGTAALRKEMLGEAADERALRHRNTGGDRVTHEVSRVGRPIVAASRLSRRLDPLKSGSAGRIAQCHLLFPKPYALLRSGCIECGVALYQGTTSVVLKTMGQRTALAADFAGPAGQPGAEALHFALDPA